jgi:hypothetical protein
MTTPRLTEKQACWRIHELDPVEAQRTFVVLGTVHGGTSMIAGLLRLLGIHMGTNLDSTHENRQFREALLGNRTLADHCRAPLHLYTTYRRLVRQYNEAQAIWGIKDPLLTFYLPLLARYWRNPMYILVLRNLAATAESQARHFQHPFAKRLTRVLISYQWLYRFAMASHRPLLIINYEAAMQNKEEVIRTLVDYCGVPVDTERYQAALAFMDQQKGYQWFMDDNTATLVGFIEGVANQQVYGWAFNPQTQQPVTLALLHQGVEIARTTAHRPRPDVLKNASFARLPCGFVFDVAPQSKALHLDAIQVIDVAGGGALRRMRSM